MAVDYYRQLVIQAYTSQFAEWEKQALVPRDIARTPNEYHSRSRVAEVMRDLRREYLPALAPATVLQELRDLVVAQTKALNCVQVWSPEEVATMQQKVAQESDWSTLLKWMKNTRRETMRRYDAQTGQAHGCSDGWPHESNQAA